MNLHKQLLTKNECYQIGTKIKPQGIMVHSTGANNPNLRRYVGPDDGLLGRNSNGNTWNQFRPGGKQVCVHAFIGLLKNGTVATYQTLPWDTRGWHAGTGTTGRSANDSYIGFEICEDKLTDPVYFGKVYQEAVDLCVYLCKLYGLTEKNIICHSEGYKKGIASNHGDVMHWFPKHGKNMDTFRADVKAALQGTQPSPEPQPEPEGQSYKVKVSVSDLRIRKGPGTNYGTTGKFTGIGTFTIVEEQAGKGSSKGWGRLKSGAGWIALDYCTRV